MHHQSGQVGRELEAVGKVGRNGERGDLGLARHHHLLDRPIAPQAELSVHPAGGRHRQFGVNPGSAMAPGASNYERFS